MTRRVTIPSWLTYLKWEPNETINCVFGLSPSVGQENESPLAALNSIIGRRWPLNSFESINGLTWIRHLLRVKFTNFDLNVARKAADVVCFQSRYPLKFNVIDEKVRQETQTATVVNIKNFDTQSSGNDLVRHGDWWVDLVSEAGWIVINKIWLIICLLTQVFFPTLINTYTFKIHYSSR